MTKPLTTDELAMRRNAEQIEDFIVLLDGLDLTIRLSVLIYVAFCIVKVVGGMFMLMVEMTTSSMCVSLSHQIK